VRRVSVAGAHRMRPHNRKPLPIDVAERRKTIGDFRGNIYWRSLNRWPGPYGFSARSYLCPIARARERRIIWRPNGKEGRMDVGIWDWEWSRVLWWSWEEERGRFIRQKKEKRSVRETWIEIYELDLLVRIYFIYLYPCILNLFSHLN